MTEDNKAQIVSDLNDHVMELEYILTLIEDDEFEDAMDELESASGTPKTILTLLRDNTK